MNSPTNTSSPQSDSPADLSIGELLKRLKPKEVYAIAATMLGMLSAASACGWFLQSYVGTNNRSVVDAIAATEENNPYQMEIRKRPSVQTFERFLDAAETERWGDAFSLTSHEWRSQHNTQQAEDLAREYRMTHRHHLHYYIPRKISDDREVYDVDFEFSDFIPPLPVREGLARSRIADVLKREKVDNLANELLSELPRHYVTTGLSRTKLETYVKQFTADLTLRDCAIRDDLIEVLGSHDHLKLTPIVIKEAYSGKPPAVQKRRFVKATLVKNAGQWNVHSYDSFMVEKR